MQHIDAHNKSYFGASGRFKEIAIYIGLLCWWKMYPYSVWFFKYILVCIGWRKPKQSYRRKIINLIFPTLDFYLVSREAAIAVRLFEWLML